ncbi:MAG: hypothetical protein HPY58_01430 [Firmicutes bacterium]|nr:hypothetical protein [Bacillota bacterium]
MWRYEEICQDFLDAAENAGLFVCEVHHIMDVITCDREFRCTCTIDESEPPYRIWAEVGFTWNTLLTAESIYGDNCPLCKKYPLTPPFEREPSDSFIELEVRICFETVKFEEAGTLARQIQNLIGKLITHNQPQIKFEVSVLPEGKVVVHDSYIYYLWLINIKDEKIEFLPICEEIRLILDALVNSSLFG